MQFTVDPSEADRWIKLGTLRFAQTVIGTTRNPVIQRRLHYIRNIKSCSFLGSVKSDAKLKQTSLKMAIAIACKKQNTTQR